MGRLAEMETLVAVVRNGTITAAAEQLGSAKSAVSRRLRELESRLGVQLPARVRAFIDALAEAFDPDRPYWDA